MKLLFRQAQYIILIILLSFELFAANYYVSTTASGSGNASSWANKDDAATFNFSGLSAGDIVYIDGGASDSLLYDGVQILLEDVDGTSGSRITITRGVDAGHTGKPVFLYPNGISGDAGLQINNSSYITISYLQFMQKSGSNSGYQGINPHTCNNIIFTYNIVYHAYSKGMRIDYVDGMEISHNKFYGNIGSISGADTVYVKNTTGGSYLHIQKQ